MDDVRNTLDTEVKRLDDNLQIKVNSTKAREGEEDKLRNEFSDFESKGMSKLVQNQIEKKVKNIYNRIVPDKTGDPGETLTMLQELEKVLDIQLQEIGIYGK
jgi:Fe2+ transport system protein B